MSFYVQRTLATGLFRFMVGRRRELSSIDQNVELSTGPSGEFIRHRPEVFYSADHRPLRPPELPPMRSIATTPFTASLIDKSPRGIGFIALMAFGALFILFGLMVVLGKGPQGWVLVFLGLAMAAVPIVVTAQKRRQIRAIEERRRAERAERDARDRELLAAYAGSLDRMREDPNDATLDQVRQEREKLDLTYAIWGDSAVATVLQVGFNALARVGAERAAEIATLMDRASSAAGLVAEDALGVKHALYRTVLWHFLADDRLGERQIEIVKAIQSGLKITDEEVPIDTSSSAQLDRLRGIDHRNVPRCESSLPLLHGEYCIYTTTSTTEGASGNVYVTNKRFVTEGVKREEILLPDVDEIEVDADRGSVTVHAAERKAPLTLKSDEPIYLASLLSLATTLDERPRGFA
ncbi:MAG TPA: hypothetical protein VFL80_10845 [Thermoanaerobaculia bacterium]|nr:hypothetical protein [Thermoanaerobaculia bacterium]